MEINKNITSVNRTVMSNKENKYIVVHYVGAVSSAYNNTAYFKSVNRSASATYFVDEISIWQCVEEKDAAWHCGASTYYNGARNNNSIGIEMCCYNNKGVLDISDKTINNAIELVKDIMKRYNIPVENVVRHYDVTRKVCPAPFVNDVARWNDFKNRLVDEVKKELKPVEEVAKEVIAGKWGNGTDRVNRLTEAGYNYSEVQAKVNELLTGKPATKKYEVINTTSGVWCRKGMGFNYAKYKVIPYNTKLEIVKKDYGTANGYKWDKVIYNGVTVYLPNKWSKYL